MRNRPKARDAESYRSSGTGTGDLREGNVRVPERGLRHVLHQTGWGVGTNAVGLTLRYALVLVIARYYGALVLGVYALSVAIGMAASLAATVGMDRAISALRASTWITLRTRPPTWN